MKIWKVNRLRGTDRQWTTGGQKNSLEHLTQVSWTIALFKNFSSLDWIKVTDIDLHKLHEMKPADDYEIGGYCGHCKY